MPAPYNMTEIEASRNLFQLFAATNEISNNLLVQLGLITYATILLIILLRRNSPPEAVVAAGLSAVIIALIFLSIDLINAEWTLGFTMILAIATTGVYLRNKIG